jgi:uncharacterized membrane protein YccC
MDNKKYNESESLKRSHSKSSNAKLTLLCFFTILAFTILWGGLAMIGIEKIPTVVSVIVTACGGVLTLLGLIGFNAFKR